MHLAGTAEDVSGKDLQPGGKHLTIPEEQTGELESAMENACRKGVMPGAILQAANTSGSFIYYKSFGDLSLEPSKYGKPMAVDSVLVIASCTKLMTAIAALQCVERGQIELDDDLTGILPEISKLEVLNGFNSDGIPHLNKRQNKLTLRRLLTNTSGLSYVNFDEQLRKYIAYRKDPTLGTGGTVAAKFADHPLLFEPGTDWIYGPSLDWAGKMVERLNGGMSLEQYMKNNIWEPLGVKDITFLITTRPDMEERRAGTARRGRDGKLHHHSALGATDGLEECFGGQGAYASMPDYLKILHSLLADDEKLLRRETSALLFSPQLEAGAKKGFDSLKPRPGIFSYMIGEFPDYSALDHSLGGMVTRTGDSSWRGKGTLIWGSISNMFWYIDRQNEVCGVFGTQVVPPADADIRQLISLFERTMLQRAKES